MDEFSPIFGRKFAGENRGIFNDEEAMGDGVNSKSCNKNGIEKDAG